MKKIFFLGAAAMLSAFTATSQCTTGGTLFGSAPAPCSDTPPVSVDIAAFEVWRGDQYEITNVKVGGTYVVDICQSALPGGGGSAWAASLTIQAPSGTVEAFGLDGGSLCELTFTATEAGAYQIFVNEVGECPGVSQSVDNGSPRVTYTGGADCDPPVTTCEAGLNNGVSEGSICPGETSVLSILGMVVPNSPTQGDAFIEFTPTDPLNTSGLGGEFVLTGFTAEDLEAYAFDNDLNGVLSGNGFPVMEDEWEIKGFVTTVDGTYFDPLTRCDSTAAVATVDFLTFSDPGCTPVTACEAGILDQAGLDNELCPGEATDYSVTGVTIPNAPVSGEYILEFSPVPGSGSGGPFGTEPDPSFFLTLNGVLAGDENADFTVSLDAELLTTGVAQPALMGEWNVRGGVFTDGAFPCDSVPNVVIDFKDANEFPCGGVAPCENPYPAVDNASLSVVENANNSITFSWDPIPGQIGCQVNAVVGNGPQQANIIVGGANASSFTAGASQLNDFTTYNFRVRCGCQQNPSVIAGPFTDFVSIFYLGASGISQQPEIAAEEKLLAAKTQGLGLAQNSTGDFSQLRDVNQVNIANGTIGKRTVKAVKTSFDVFPNPSSGAVNLKYEASAEGMVNVRVFDVVGKAVADYTMSVNAGMNFMNMDLSSFEKGIYVIEVLEGELSSTSKVVLK